MSAGRFVLASVGGFVVGFLLARAIGTTVETEPSIARGSRPPSSSSRSSGDPGAAEEASPEMRELRREIRSLARLLESRVAEPLRPATDPGPDPEVTVIRERDPAEVAEFLPEILARLTALETLVRERGITSGELPEAADSIPKNVDKVLEARLLYLGDRQAAERAHFCWTPLRVYRTYGMPDRVHWSGDQHSWSYRTYNDGSIHFRFKDGVVVDLQ